jgi:hypothetical protein
VNVPRFVPWWLVLILHGCGPGKAAPANRVAAASDSAPQRSARTSDGGGADSSSAWQIIPGRSAGSIISTSSEADLAKHFGGAAVKLIRVELGEGETTPGTVLFPDDSSRRAEIIWQDTVGRSRPSRLVLRGSRSRWTVGPNISLGTSLKDLERINGRPFTLAGFGWDYAGVVTEWGGGALDSALAGVRLYLDPGPSQYQSAPYSQVLGDRDYSSALPPMQQLNPRVAQIFVDFE